METAEQVTADLDLEAYRREVEQLERQSAALVVFDDTSEEAALLFIAECKRAHTAMEEARDAKVRPHNEFVREVNKAFKPFTDILERLRKATDQQRSAYVTKKQLAIAEANRKAIAEAEQKKREEEAKAEAARQEAERLRKEAERVAQEELDREFQAEMEKLELERRQKAAEQAIKDAQSAKAIKAAEEESRKLREEQDALERSQREAREAAAAEQLRLEKAAIKQETKADLSESKATMVTPTIQASMSTGPRTLVDGSKVGSRKTVDWCFTNGMAKDMDYYADDPRVKDIPARYFVLDLSKLGRDVKNGVPVDGTLRTEGTTTTAGRK